MDKEQFQNNMMMFENGIIDYVTFTLRCIQYINSLEAENEKLKEPKKCETCIYFMDGVCECLDIPEFSVPSYISLLGCGLHEPKAP